MKRLIINILAIFCAVSVAAQGDITFDVAAPTVVEKGELFRVEFIVGGSRKAEFTPPTIEGFEVMAGPSGSTAMSVEMIGGKSTRTETTTWTYVLQAFEAGVHSISGARATVGDRSYETKPVSIEVVEGTSSGSSLGEGTGARATTVSEDDIFVRATVSRTSVYKGEPVVVSLKLYSRVQFGLDNLTPPALNGFWQQDISAQQVREERETVDGRVYNSYVLKQYLLYPQQAGTLTVEPFDATVSVLIQSAQSTPRNIFDELMGGMSGMQQVQRKISSGAVRVTVKDWPAGAPESFDGAVGQFDISSTPPQPLIAANTSASYTLRLEGTGNFPLVRTPALEFPASFEKYNVTSTDNIHHTATGTKGFREFTYPFIPRADGVYTIPAPEFSFFDPTLGKYVTLSSREISVEVTADSTAVSTPGGIVSGVSREDLQIFGQDIQFIKRGAAGLRPKDRVLMWSVPWIVGVVLCVVIFVCGYVFGGRYLRNMQNDRFVRSKRANRMALKRLRVAGGAMASGDRHLFYDEMLKGLWGYMSDKLDIPPAELGKDRIREELFERGVADAYADEFVAVISECEQAQYSPSGGAQMSELYKKGVELISRLEL